MTNPIWYYLVMLFGVIIACLSQLLLKRAALQSYDKWYKQYLNVRVIAGYAIMVLSTFCTLFAYRMVPLSSGPIWTAAQQFLMTGLCLVILKEKPNKRKLIGLLIIAGGVLVFII